MRRGLLTYTKWFSLVLLGHETVKGHSSVLENIEEIPQTFLGCLVVRQDKSSPVSEKFAVRGWFPCLALNTAGIFVVVPVTCLG